MGGDWLVCICSQDGERDYSCLAPFLLSTQSKSLLILTNLDYKIPHRHFPKFCFHCESDDFFFPRQSFSLSQPQLFQNQLCRLDQPAIVSLNPVKLTIKIIHHIMMKNTFSVHEHFLLLCLRHVVQISAAMYWVLYTPFPFLQKKS